jgi:Bacterial toxin 44
MLSYDDLYHAPVDKMKANIDEWTEMIGKLRSISKDMAGNVAGPLRNWQGKASNAAETFVRETTKECDDAVKEATGIRDILSEAHARIAKQRAELHKITHQDAPDQGLVVDSQGKVSAKNADEPAWYEPGIVDKLFGRDGARTQGEQTQAAVAAMQKRIERARADATEADDTAAWALHVNLGGEQHNFTAPQHTTLWDAWRAGQTDKFKHSRDYIYDEMMRNKDDPRLTDTNAINRRKVWYDLVKTGGPWDHKPILEKMYGMDTKNDFDFKDPDKNRAVSYDLWSNIHYGYVGRAHGISWTELDKGHQLGSVTGNTDQGDVTSVREGMRLYEKYGPNMTREQFQSEIPGIIDKMEKTGSGQVRPWR